MKQQSGQDERAFLESIKAAAGKGDIQGMALEDALCLVCLTGIKDNRLREKLSELGNSHSTSFCSVDRRIYALKSDGRLFSCCSSSCGQAAEPAGGKQEK